MPYRANRAVLFDSSLLHQTDPDYAFLPGYDNHRINLTLLFGNTDEACLREAADAAGGGAGGDANPVRVAVGPTGRAADAGSRVQWG